MLFTQASREVMGGRKKGRENINHYTHYMLQKCRIMHEGKRTDN
jgi:hypothetical protein